MPCTACRPLDLELMIRTPGELAKAIRVAQDNLEDGTLIELASEWSPPVRTVAPDGPWGDFLLWDFRCNTCNATYRLTAETYHGQGGSWAPLHST